MNKFLYLYRELLKKHGSPKDQWSLWCRRPKTKRQREEVIIGAILTQNTNWQNVKKAIANLKQAKKCSLKLILELKTEKLEQLIRPSGFYKTKAKYLQGVARFIIESGGVGKLMKREGQELRRGILKLKGVGPETADSILLYALDRPVFVVDEYTRRIARAKNLVKNMDYEYLRKLFEDNLPKKFEVYQDFHALIVVEGKHAGRKAGK
ncbi:endonuclease [Candidatus Kuenenbacteria bacterium]|nr:endonuclease [Candidatus Kuenenbacteria bacterium]